MTSATLTRNLALLFLLNSIALNGVLRLVSPPAFNKTVLHHTRDLLIGRHGGDSWVPMQAALDHINSRSVTSLYQRMFHDRTYQYEPEFIYPPSALFALKLARLASPEREGESDATRKAWQGPPDGVAWAFILVLALTTAALLEIRLRQSHPASDFGRGWMPRAVLVIGLALTFYPVAKAFTLGQIQVWINSMFAVSLLCWVTGRKRVAGVLIGLICLVKPHFALFLVWGLVRREWRFVLTSGLVILAGVAASVAVFGWRNHVEYPGVLSYIAEHGRAFHSNQSVNGLLNRLMSVREPNLFRVLDFQDRVYPPFHPLVYWGTLLSSIALLITAIVPRRREGDPGRVFDFCTMAASVTLASPVSWWHTYGVLFPIFAVVLASSLGNPRRLGWLIVSYVAVSTFIQATQPLAPTVLNVAISLPFAGALILLILLHSRPWAAPVTAGTGRSESAALSGEPLTADVGQPPPATD